MTEEALFFPDGDLFVPTDLAASPWGSTLLHGGPPAALLARAIERTTDDPDMQVARLTIDLFRPVPKVPLRVETHVVREGKRIQVVDATLYSGDEAVTRASALMLRRTEGGLPSAQPPTSYLPGPEGLAATGLGGAAPGSAARPVSMPGNKGFHTTAEIRRLQGTMGGGGGAAWFRVPVPVVAGEEITPLMRTAATADFGSPMGSPRLAEGIGFINADITLYLHRMPVGEWICLEAKGFAQPYGLGMSETVVHDLGGPIGRVVQATIMNPRQRPQG